LSDTSEDKATLDLPASASIPEQDSTSHRRDFFRKLVVGVAAAGISGSLLGRFLKPAGATNPTVTTSGNSYGQVAWFDASNDITGSGPASSTSGALTWDSDSGLLTITQYTLALLGTAALSVGGCANISGGLLLGSGTQNSWGINATQAAAGANLISGANNDTSTNYGVGVFGGSCSPLGIGVKGQDQVGSTVATGSSVGVIGQTYNSSGTGVIGLALNGSAVALAALGSPSGQSGNLQEWQTSNGTVWSPVSVVNAQGWLGVGTSTPEAPLTVVSPTTITAALIGSTQGNLIFAKSGTNGFSMYSNAANYLGFYSNDSGLQPLTMNGSGIAVGNAYKNTAPPTNGAIIQGDVGIGTSSPAHLIQLSGGAYSDGSTWTNSSDRNLKENFNPIDEQEVLDRLVELPIERWNYKRESKEAQHVGPVAQDFYAAFHLGKDDKSISTVDAAGVALAAIKALHKTVKEQQRKIEVLERKLAAS